jgi:photosystem II stability/assembly factor-like uncharacterized protein
MRDKTHHQQHPLTSNRASLSHQAGTRAKYISPLLRITAILIAATLTTHAKAQWDIEESHTTASLRGIHNAGGGVAWASGTHGTVLRTEDGGYLWQTCNIPPGAETLDFRGIQAFDENTAIVMSSGPGDQSRLYKTTDGCQTWHLLFTNPDKEGFWDAILFLDSNNGIVFGDPANGGFSGNYTFRIRVTQDGGQTWAPVTDPEHSSPGKNLMPLDKEGLFAASNSSASSVDGSLWVGTGHGRILRRRLYTDPAQRAMAFQASYCAGAIETLSHSCGIPWVDWITNNNTPLTAPGDSSGVFSIHFRDASAGIVVGGDYQKPDANAFNVAWSQDGGNSWHAAQTPPHGYRSSVAYDPTQKLWITVGPNGTDISRDDGRNWQPLKPSNQDPADADKNWNALSLPFVVGPNGRIGRLRTITPPSAKPQATK